MLAKLMGPGMFGGGCRKAPGACPKMVGPDRKVTSPFPRIAE
jgi:hypothetical protein